MVCGALAAREAGWRERPLRRAVDCRRRRRDARSPPSRSATAHGSLAHVLISLAAPTSNEARVRARAAPQPARPWRTIGAASADHVDIAGLSRDQMRALQDELSYTKENLQAAIEELETTNEELQATNEELIASNEELQSTNEELHSVNEELYTVNAEYQKKNVELQELNDDIEHLLNGTDVAHDVPRSRRCRIRQVHAAHRRTSSTSFRTTSAARCAASATISCIRR